MQLLTLVTCIHPLPALTKCHMYVFIPSDQCINNELLPTNEAAFIVSVATSAACVCCKFDRTKERIRCAKSNSYFLHYFVSGCRAVIYICIKIICGASFLSQNSTFSLRDEYYTWFEKVTGGHLYPPIHHCPTCGK